MKRIAIIPSIVVLLALVTLGVTLAMNTMLSDRSDPPAADSPTRELPATRLEDPQVVTVGDNFISPPAFVVAIGTPVTFEWTGSNEHWLVSTSPGGFDSGARRDGTYEFEFAIPGNYEIHCTVHGKPAMSATIRVE